MKKYEEPKMAVIKIDTEDIIQTSGLNLGDNTNIGGTGGIFVPTSISTSLNNKY